MIRRGALSAEVPAQSDIAPAAPDLPSSRGDGRRTRSRGERFSPERREEIIREATQLFLERGYEHVSIDALIDRVGGSKGTLYAQFGGKPGLFEMCIRDYCERTSRDLEIQFDPNAPCEEPLARFGRAFLDLILSRETLSLHRLVLSMAATFPEVALIFYESGPERAYRMMEEWVTRQQEAGRLRAGDARGLAILYVDMLTARHQLAALLGIDEEVTPEKIAATVRNATTTFLAAHGIDR